MEIVLKISEGDHERTGRVVARSFYKMLRDNGFSHPEIISLAGRVLDEVIKDIRANGKDREAPMPAKASSASGRSMEMA